jgi:hypothetical protein
MADYTLITERDLADFGALVRRSGWREEDFDLQEDAFDPQKAELEGAFGEVGIQCLRNGSVQVYRLGSGFTWVEDFAADLRSGKFGTVKVDAEG